MNFSNFMQRAIEKMGVYAPLEAQPEELDHDLAVRRIEKAVLACAKHKIAATKRVKQLLKAKK